jgi:ABC-type transporter Mla MlaB component
LRPGKTGRDPDAENPHGGRTCDRLAADIPEVTAITGEVITLPTELDRASLAGLRARLERLSHGATVTFDGSRVRRADTTGVQLLCALVLAAEGRGVVIRWLAVSAVLVTYVSLLGVGDVMRFDGASPDTPEWFN